MSLPNFSLEGKVAIVTGGKRGIGKAIALAYAEAGADVVVCGRTVEDGELSSVAEEIQGLGRRSLAIHVDVSCSSDVEHLVKKTVAEFGVIDILVNNAAVSMRSALLETDESSWDTIMNIDLKGSFLCCRSVGKVMVEQKKGNIINMTSPVAIRPAKWIGPYAIAKAGVIVLTRTLAQELGPSNVRVNAICPSFVSSPMSPVFNNPGKARRAVATVPLGRLGEPSDIVGAAIYLASDASSYVSGHILVVDGGRVA